MDENAAEYLRQNEEQVMIRVKVFVDTENRHKRWWRKQNKKSLL